jgi:hypothetical protein
MKTLRELLKTRHVDVMPAKLAAPNVRRPHISGFGDRRCFTVLAEQFPEELRQQAIEAANNVDGWNGFFDRPK